MISTYLIIKTNIKYAVSRNLFNIFPIYVTEKKFKLHEYNIIIVFIMYILLLLLLLLIYDHEIVCCSRIIEYIRNCLQMIVFSFVDILYKLSNYIYLI